MTRKSQARLRRDEFKQKNTAWDDLRQIYCDCQSNLNMVVSTTKAFFDIQNIHLFIPADHASYAVSVIKSLAADVNNFQTRLNDIYKRHKDRSGMFVFGNDDSAADYMLLIGLGSEYVNFQNDYTTILLPVYNQALGLIQTIENNVARIANQEQAQAAANETEGALQ